MPTTLRLRDVPVLLAFLAFLAPLTGQTEVTSPAGFLNTEGRDYARFGQWSNGRAMHFDGEMRGRPMLINQVSLRRDSTSSFGGMGRAWTNVSLRVSDCDYARISTDFDTNPTSTPTQVFNGPVSWPTLGPPPGSGPEPWGYHFAFQNPWLYLGATDICLDFDFTGGRLANNGSWPNNYGLAYFMDSALTEASATGTSSVFTAGGCTDSRMGSGSQMEVDTAAHNATHAQQALQNTFELSTESSRTAPGRPVVHVVSPWGQPGGVPWPGVGCERVFFDLARPVLFVFGIASNTSLGSTGPVYPTRTPQGLVPYNAALANLPLWAQAAWNDSLSGALLLTPAVRAVLPAAPRWYRRAMIFHYDPVLKTRRGLGPEADGYYNPIMRFRG